MHLLFSLFKDTMRLNDSYELAFFHDIPEDYPAYEGRGTFTKHLYLNNQGLKGDGTIYYLNSVTVTDSIYFIPEHSGSCKYNRSKNKTHL